MRLLADRNLLSGALEDIPFPDSVQALIAARLDTLSPDRKQLLQDAAVVGSVFWTGALAEIGSREPREVELALHELARKELVRPARTSSMEGEQEYGFWHLLVRDVCYAQIPRSARAARHRSAADWIERKAGDRAEDLADVLAHHFLTALELAGAAGHAEESKELEAHAIRYLVLAGERALPLDVASAEAQLARALARAPAGHSQRAILLERWGQAAQQQGRLQEAKAALEEALALDRERGETIAAGRALTALNVLLRRLGDPRSEDAIAEAITLLEAQPPGRDLVAAYAELSGTRLLGNAHGDAIAAAEQALRIAAEIGLAEPARALGYRGAARAYLGERDGLEDMRRALALAIEQGRGRDAATLHNNLAISIWAYEVPKAALAACQEGLDFCERRGIAEFTLGIAAMRLTFLAASDDLELVLVEAEPLVARLEATSPGDVVEARSVQLRLLAQRGEHGPASVAAAEAIVATARESGELQMMSMAFAAAAELLLAQGRPEQARALLAELEHVSTIRADPYFAAHLPELVRAALTAGDRALAVRLADGVEPVTPLAEHALCACSAQLAEAAGGQAESAALYAEAAERWREFGNVAERGYALLGQGRCLRGLGKSEAEQPLREARELFQSLGYKPALAETEALLGENEAAAV